MTQCICMSTKAGSTYIISLAELHCEETHLVLDSLPHAAARMPSGPVFLYHQLCLANFDLVP